MLPSLPDNGTLLISPGKGTERESYLKEREKAMLESLEEAFKEVAQLPEDEQRHIVEIIRQEIASEKRWQILFHDPRSERVLENLVAEALAEDAAGETEEISGESFLS
jgi:hypothetical protein